MISQKDIFKSIIDFFYTLLTKNNPHLGIILSGENIQRRNKNSFPNFTKVIQVDERQVRNGEV